MESKKEIRIKLLTYETIKEKMNILCAVSLIKKDKLIMSLPGSLKGILPIINISPWLGEDNSLKKMYEVGDVFTCHVVLLQNSSNNSEKKTIILSTDPHLINENLRLNDFYKGMSLYTLARSKEDHGWVMDVGIPSVQAFLKATGNESLDSQIRIGHVISCIVSEVNSSCVQLLYKPAKKLVSEKKDLSLRELLPGQSARVTVRKAVKTGLEVDCYNAVGVIHNYHFQQPFTSSEHFKIGKELDATVLYVDPQSKVVHLTLNAELYRNKEFAIKCSKGDWLSNAVVMEKKSNSIILNVEDKLRLLCGKNYWPSKNVTINSVHEVCVIGLNLIDNIVYVSMKEECSASNVVNYSDIVVGQILMTKVKTLWSNGGLEVEVNPGVTGFIPSMHKSDDIKQSKKFKLGDQIQCRVLQNGPNLILTAKESIINLNGPIVTSYEEVKSDSVITGVVTFINERSITMKFFNNVKGLITSKALRKSGVVDHARDFYVGQTLSCRVLKCLPEKKTLFLILNDCERRDDSEKIEIGKIYGSSKVLRVKNKLIEVQLEDNLTAFLPTYHFSDCRRHCNLFEHEVAIGKDLGSVVGFSNVKGNFVTRKRSFIDACKKGPYESVLEENSVVPCMIKSMSSIGFYVKMLGDINGFVYFSNMTDFCPESFEFYKGLSLMCKILKTPKKFSQSISLSTNLSHVWNSEARADINWFKYYLNEKRRIEKLLTNNEDEKLSFLARNVNKVVKFCVTEKTKNSINGYLDEGLQIPATASTFNENIEVGSWVDAFVINVDLITIHADLTLLPPVISSKLTTPIKKGLITNAKALLITQEFAVLLLLDGSNRLAYLPIKKHLNDLVDHTSEFTLQETYRVKIVNTQVRNALIAELHTLKRKNPDGNEVSNNSVSKTRKKNEQQSPKEETTNKRQKRKREESNEQQKKKKIKTDVPDNINGTLNCDDAKEEKCLDIGNDFNWQDSWEMDDRVNGGDVDDNEIEEDDDNVKAKKKKKSSKKEKDEQIFLKERELADESRLPETEDEFERLILSSPDSSLVWLQYTAFHLQNLQVDRARAVCKRALSVISFRQEQERLNVWVALLNLENTYGTEETFKQTVMDAEKNNDMLKITKHTVNILRKDNKIEEAIEIFTSLIKRYKKDERIWIEYVTFLMEIQKFDKAREVLSRCESNLSSKQIVDVTSKMGQLEFKIGDAERGRTVFENLVANHPKRTDLWSVYVDLEIKAGNVDLTRSLLERAISIKGSARQMKFLFKKYYEFEKTHGDVKNLAHVKQKADEYINSE